jgi:hypothetical protein
MPHISKYYKLMPQTATKRGSRISLCRNDLRRYRTSARACNAISIFEISFIKGVCLGKACISRNHFFSLLAGQIWTRPSRKIPELLESSRPLKTDERTSAVPSCNVTFGRHCDGPHETANFDSSAVTVVLSLLLQQPKWFGPLPRHEYDQQ